MYTFLQKPGWVTARGDIGTPLPVLLPTAYIINGNWNDIPNAKRNCNTNVTKSIMFKNVTSPADSPYLYKNSNINGMTNE